jgi:hypothetical protein
MLHYYVQKSPVHSPCAHHHHHHYQLVAIVVDENLISILPERVASWRRRYYDDFVDARARGKNSPNTVKCDFGYDERLEAHLQQGRREDNKRVLLAIVDKTSKPRRSIRLGSSPAPDGANRPSKNHGMHLLGACY